MEQLDGYLSSPGVDSRPTEIVEYDDFGYRYDHHKLDNFNEGFEDNYTPLYFGIFRTDNETEEQRQAREAEEQRVRQEAERRRLEEERQAQERERLQQRGCSDHPSRNLLKEDALNQANHVVNILNQTKTMIAASVPNARKTTDGDQSTSKKKDDEDDAPTGFQDHRKEFNHIFGGPLAYESKRKQKLTEREINAVQPDTPQYLQWSETAIKFDRSNHPDRVVHPGRYRLVLDPVVRNVKLRRSLINGGSALNILFAKTLDDIQIPRTELKPSNAPFHGVIPGLSSTRLGQITLPDTFDTWENFRTENICFEVADFETVYHVIFGRPALAKFMVVPHYTYMMMKMPGPRGVISLRSDIKQAVTCDKESCEMAQTREITLAREKIRLAASTATE
uniref:B1160F02.22 protein n=1 Tax=Oryza sativa subsp. japonica TaxID=39947 RepID=Q6MWF4_ORYSJ|nr:B1160F02.22 [Oryza sativa Japonica Group]